VWEVCSDDAQLSCVDVDIDVCNALVDWTE